MTKTDVLDALQGAMSPLIKLGYTMSQYDAGPEYGAVFESSEKNRRIEFDFSAIIGQPFSCTIRRKYRSLFSFLISPSDRRLSFNLGEEYRTEDLYSKLPKTIDSPNHLENLRLYSAFFNERLLGIISGEHWITDK
jgi:hypothetical protein